MMEFFSARGEGFALQDFGPRGGVSIAGFSDFRARSARNLASGAEGAGLEKFLAFSEKNCFLKIE